MDLNDNHHHCYRNDDHYLFKMFAHAGGSWCAAKLLLPVMQIALDVDVVASIVALILGRAAETVDAAAAVHVDAHSQQFCGTSSFS